MPGATADLKKSLKRVSLFADLSEAELMFLIDHASMQHYGSGQLIFSEGDACEGLYVIESGEIKIFKTSVNGREQVLAVEGAGSTVAELPVFDGGSYPASAMAVTQAQLLHISKKDFHTLCLQHPEVALKVLRVVGSRLRHLVDIIEEVSFTTVHHRLAALLVRIAKTKGKQTNQGVAFTLTVTNQEIAAQIGTVRELVSRNLSRMQDAGIIKLEGKKVIVPDLKTLEAEVEGAT